MSSIRPWTHALRATPLALLLGVALAAQGQSAGEARDLALDALRLEFERDNLAATDEVLESAFKEACERGYSSACRRSNWLADGEASLQRASGVFEPSCEAGDPVACMVVGWALDESASQKRGDEERNRTWRRAAKLFKDTCDADFPAACHDYGVFLYENRGLKADPRTALNRWKGACDDGEWASCTVLARLHKDGGSGVRQDAGAAKKYARLACDGGYADGCALLGSLEDSTYDAATLDEWYGGLCDQGHKDSCWRLARTYYDGIHPEPVEGRTQGLFERACELRHARSCFEAGRWEEDLETGSPDKAAQLYGLACDLGDPAGCAAQVDLFLMGKVVGSVKEAPHAYEVACEARQSVEACAQLAFALIDGLDIARDAERGRMLLQRACANETSDPVSCFALGRAYEEGLGGPRDRTESSQYYRWACVAGHLESCDRRGDLLMSDVGVRRDDHEALNMFERACEGGMGDACLKAGTILDEATFVSRDAPRAASLYERGCEAGSGGGCYRLGQMHEEGIDGPPDMAAARSAYEQALGNGSLDAKRTLSRLLWFGYGGKKDKRRAKQLASEACQNGDPIACRGPAFLGE